MSEDKVWWTIDLIEKLQKNGIGDLQKFDAIRSYLQRDGKLTDADREYLKEKYNELQLKLNTGPNVKNETSQNDVTSDNTFTNDNRQAPASEDDPSLQILKNRLAKGEITVEGFDNLKSKLLENSSVHKLKEEIKNVNEEMKKIQDEQKTAQLVQTRRKSEGTTVTLSLVLGLIGFPGIGHIYVGHGGKGVAILVPSLILFYWGISTASNIDSYSYFTPTFGWFLLFIYFIIFIWQIFYARNLCREYNQNLERHLRFKDI